MHLDCPKKRPSMDLPDLSPTPPCFWDEAGIESLGVFQAHGTRIPGLYCGPDTDCSKRTLAMFLTSLSPPTPLVHEALVD